MVCKTIYLLTNPYEVISKNNTINVDSGCKSCDVRSLYGFILHSLDFNVLISKNVVNSITVILSPSKIAISGRCFVNSCSVVLYCNLLLPQ